MYIDTVPSRDCPTQITDQIKCGHHKAFSDFAIWLYINKVYLLKQ